MKTITITKMDAPIAALGIAHFQSTPDSCIPSMDTPVTSQAPPQIHALVSNAQVSIGLTIKPTRNKPTQTTQ
ncbi:MAG: hypothetical protein OXT70_07010 [Chloroflexota bacterium]|nr:hypothetical protein [Chloroflexota bacterium]